MNSKLIAHRKNKVFFDYIYNLSYNVVNVFFPIIIVPYISRVLGPVGIGNYNYVNAIVTYFGILGNMGVSLYAQREIGYLCKEKEKRSVKFYNIFFLRLCSIFFTFVVYIILFFSYIKTDKLYAVFLLQFVTNALDISWYLYGMRIYKSIVLRHIVLRIAGLAAIFIFVKEEKDVWIYALILLLIGFGGAVSIMPIAIKSLNKIIWKQLNIFKEAKPMLSLFIPQIGASIYEILDKWILGLISTKEQVGFYSQPQRIIILLCTIISSLGFVLFPKISNYIYNGKEEIAKKVIIQYVSIIFLVGSPLVFGLISISDIFVPVFLSEQYRPSINIIMVLAPLILINNLQNAFGTQYLVTYKKQKEYDIAIYVGMGINLTMNFLLIPKFGGVGAATSSLIAESFVLLIEMFFLRKVFIFRTLLKENIEYVMASLVMGIIVFFISGDENIFCLFYKIFIGISFYFFFLLFRRRKIINFFNCIKN